VLNVDDYGRLTLLRITISIMLMVGGLGIIPAVYRFYFQSSEGKREDLVVGTAFLTLMGFSAVIALVLMVFAGEISQLYFGTTYYKDLFFLIFITIFFDTFNEFAFSMFRIHEQSVKYVVVSLVGMACSLTLNIYFVAVLRIGIKGVLLSSLLSAILMSLIFAPYLFSKLRFKYSFKMLKEILDFGLPLVPASLASFGLIYADTFFLKHFSTLENVGIYSLAYKFGLLVLVLIVDPFDTTWAPLKYKAVKEKDADRIYANVLTYFSFVAFFVALGISVLIKDVLVLMSGPGYFSAYKYVGLIAFSYVLYGIYRVVCLGIDLAKKTRIRAVVVIVSACINLILNYLLIPRFEIFGAALATVLSYIFMVVGTYVVSQKLYHINYQVARVAKILFSASIIYLVSLGVDIGGVIGNLLLKGGLVLTFPLLLHLVAFYSSEEISKIKYITRRVYKRVTPVTYALRGKE
jgi:O-antigen/teichoic acid export membrane protein